MNTEGAQGGDAGTAPVTSTWRRRVWRVPLVRGRLVATVMVLMAVPCAASATVWPTHTLTFAPSPLDQAGGAVAQQIAFWSWGRVANAAPASTDPALDFGNPWGLLLLVVALVAGVAAAACHALRRGSDGVLLGVAGTSWLAAHVVADLGQTAGRMDSYFYGFTEGLTNGTTTVGVLQLVAVALLLAALAMMARPPLLALVAAGWKRGSGLVQRLLHRTEPERSESAVAADGAPLPRTRAGIATIRSADPPARPPWGVGARGGDGRGVGASHVGFTDDPGADGSTPERFRPPR